MKYSYTDLDERIIKTKLALTGAILYLIKNEKKIKVLDICQKADITPMTYYHHFGNKNELLKYTIINQLSGILPIPRKLKPINLKHLVFYLVAAFNKFVVNNHELIYAAIKQAKENVYYGSYIDLITKTINFFIRDEVKQLLKQDDLQINFCSMVISGSLKEIFKQIVISGRNVNSNVIWSLIKSLFTKF